MHRWIRSSAVALVTWAAIASGCGTGSTSSSSPPPTRRHECPAIYFGGGSPVATPPDGPSLCAAGACNYQTQAGCSEADTCYLKIDQTGGTVEPACRPAGDLEKGATCDPTATALAGRCGRGLFCSNTGCRKLCCGGDWTGCDTGESCIRNLVVDLPDGRSFPANADLCLPVNDCDPLDPKACSNEGGVCRVVDPLGNVACAAGSNLKAGDDCDSEHQCGTGLICTRASAAAQGVCHHLCAFGACVEDTCGDEGTCVHFPRNPDAIGECVSNWTGPGVIPDGGVAGDGG